MTGTTWSKAPQQTPDAGTVSASRVGDVLLLLGGGESKLGVSEIARELGISKAVVHRILQSLLSRNLVAVDSVSGAYRLGAAAAALGASARQDLDLRRIAMPVLRRLQAATNETVTLSALIGDRRVYLDQIVSTQAVRMEVELGRAFPLHAGASSKAILSVAPPDLREHVLETTLPALTESTVVDANRLRADLETIEREGLAISLGERQQGAGSIGAPTFGVDGSVVGSISLCGPITRFDDASIERFKPAVRAAAAEISRGLASE